jgi:hypothetical protein
LRRLLPLTLLLGACAGSDRDAAPAAGGDSTRPQEARIVSAVAFRLPARGGAVTVHRLPDLERTPWGGGSRIAAAGSAVGLDLYGRRLLYRDSTGAVTAFDLVAMRERAAAPRDALAAVGVDGVLLAVDAQGRVTEAQPWGTVPWAGALGRGIIAVFAAPGSRLVAVRRTAADTLLVATRETGVAHAVRAPAALAIAASPTADAVAFATHSGVTVFEDRALDAPWSVPLTGTPCAVVFSPSGHRLYVALAERRAIAVVDRFAQRERATLDVPGTARALRMDPWGRVLLARAADDTETWVIAGADGRVTGRLRGSWDSDLPSVSQDGVILSREGGAVVARDLRTLDSLGAAGDAGSDLWFAARWSPPSVSVAARQRADSTTARAAPAVPAPVRPAAPGPSGAEQQPAAAGFWVQLASSRNPGAAQGLVDELRARRQNARLLAPRREGDLWRVVTGPFPSRESADSAGRSLGLPYWVVDRAREAAGPP